VLHIYIYIYDVSNLRVNDLTLILLMWRRWWTPNNASKWQMGFNSAFKGLNLTVTATVAWHCSTPKHYPIVAAETWRTRGKEWDNISTSVIYYINWLVSKYVSKQMITKQWSSLQYRIWYKSFVLHKVKYCCTEMSTFISETVFSNTYDSDFTGILPWLVPTICKSQQKIL